MEDTLYSSLYKSGSSDTNEYRQRTTENGKKKESRISGTSDEEEKYKYIWVRQIPFFLENALNKFISLFESTILTVNNGK